MGNHSSLTDKPILVTGATGYISAHVIQILLNEGYQVRGTVRSLQNQEKFAFLKNLKNSQNLTLIEAELTNPAPWDSAVSGCDYVVHIASPVPPYVPKDENQIIQPALEGVKNVLLSALKNKVKRLVFTSSSFAMYFGNQDKILDEGIWSDPTKCAHYGKAKLLAEKSVWEIYKSQNLQHYHTEIVTILPSLVLGPGLSTHNNASQTLIAEILRGNYPGIPDPEIMYSVVDVRDCALGHCLALFKPNIDGQRIALSGSAIYFSQIVAQLQKAYPQNPIKTQKVTAEEIKKDNNPIAIRHLIHMGKPYKVDHSKSIQKLDMKYRPVEETILDMAKRLKQLGVTP